MHSGTSIRNDKEESNYGYITVHQYHIWGHYIKHVLIKLTRIVLLVFELLSTPHSASAALKKLIINSSYKF